jgi:hypothetical protein
MGKLIADNRHPAREGSLAKFDGVCAIWYNIKPVNLSVA